MYAVMERIQKRSAQRAAGWVGFGATGSAHLFAQSRVFWITKKGFLAGIERLEVCTETNRFGQVSLLLLRLLSKTGL
jgi:hypothetical protein